MFARAVGQLRQTELIKKTGQIYLLISRSLLNKICQKNKDFYCNRNSDDLLIITPIVVIATVITSFVCLILKRDRQRAALSLRKSKSVSRFLNFNMLK